MGRKIIKLPDSFDPVKLIKKKLYSCPICGGEPDPDTIGYVDINHFDNKGIRHDFMTHLNKYLWENCKKLECKECGCIWDTGWYPADYSLFEIEIDKDSAAIRDSVMRMLDNLGINVKLGTLTEVDLQELQDRFGEEVRRVAEDMLNGENKRFLDNTEIGD